MQYSYHDWFNWPTTWFIRKAKQTFQYTIFVTLIHTQEDPRKFKTQNRNLIYLCPQWGDRMRNYSNYSLWVTMKMHSLNTRLPHGAALSFRLVSFRFVTVSSSCFFFFILSAFNLFCNASLGAQTERERERGEEDVQDVPRKVERNKCRRVRCSQECQDICLVKPPVKCFFFPLHKLCKMFKD